MILLGLLELIAFFAILVLVFDKGVPWLIGWTVRYRENQRAIHDRAERYLAEIERLKALSADYWRNHPDGTFAYDSVGASHWVEYEVDGSLPAGYTMESPHRG